MPRALVDDGGRHADDRPMGKSELEQRLTEACDAVSQRCDRTPTVGLVLGSGLGAFADGLADVVRLPYDTIPHLPSPTVSGHAGQLNIGAVGDVTVACLQGRVHLYEGHEPERAVFGVRMLAQLGCSVVLITNAVRTMRRARQRVAAGDGMQGVEEE